MGVEGSALEVVVAAWCYADDRVHGAAVQGKVVAAAWRQYLA